MSERSVERSVAVIVARARFVFLVTIQNRKFNSDNVRGYSKQICAYVGDSAAVARNITALKNLLLALEIEGRKMSLMISEEKTKYMKMSFTEAGRYPKI